ncbi:hypothetical protein ANO11243_009550 [Dothideomycetidae sp. 11243]|nr:hypothetical protein ANO11243_009550 [fungal sp. No.11243]
MDFDDCVETLNHDQLMPWLEAVQRVTSDTTLAKWVSTFRQGMPCTASDTPYPGGFDWCVRVDFDDGQIWMVRLVQHGPTKDRDDNLRGEVAVMKYLTQNTSIPIPKIHAWGISKDNSLHLGSFIIMDFIPGVALSSLWEKGEGDIRIRDDVPEEDLRKVYRQMSGLRDKPLVSSREYFDRVLDQNWQRLLLQASSVDDEADARSKYLIHKQIQAAACDFVSFEDPLGFRLFCDDLPAGNVLVRSATDLTIVGIIDWEWTYAAPYQIAASPPRWLALDWPKYFEADDEVDRYARLLDIFLDELQKQECLHYATEKVNLEHYGSDGSDDTIKSTLVKPQDPSSADAQDSFQEILFDDGLKVRVQMMPRLPDPSRQRLSVLMRENGDSGRLWSHEILHMTAIDGMTKAWEILTTRCPYLKHFYTPGEDEIERFVEQKMSDLARYEAKWVLVKADRERRWGKDLVDAVSRP